MTEKITRLALALARPPPWLRVKAHFEAPKSGRGCVQSILGVDLRFRQLKRGDTAQLGFALLQPPPEINYRRDLSIRGFMLFPRFDRLAHLHA
jgi:hypothetical protein